MAKSTMVRMNPHMVEMVTAMATAMEADPEMVARYGDRTGHISLSSVYRECVARGYASLRQQVKMEEPAKKAAKRRK